MAIGYDSNYGLTTQTIAGGYPYTSVAASPRSKPVRDMSYQSSGHPMDGSEMNMSQGSFQSGYEMSSQQASPSMSMDPNWPPQRSFSTPDGTTMHQNEPSATEKKRNKLGYHRTSVACSHCRRRKIRCIPSANDPQGRCANCIRLKKDCSFILTEQQQGSDARHRGSAQPSADPRSSSQASSPAGTPSANHPYSVPQGPHAPFPGVAANMPPMPPPLTAGPGPEGSMPTDLNSASRYDYSQTPPSWVPSSNIHPFLQEEHPNWSNPFRPQGDAPGGEAPAEQHPMSANWTGPREAGWGQMGVPARSMSYSGDAMRGSASGSYGMLPQQPAYTAPNMQGLPDSNAYHHMGAASVSPTAIAHSGQVPPGWQQPPPQDFQVDRPEGYGAWEGSAPFPPTQHVPAGKATDGTEAAGT